MRVMEYGKTPNEKIVGVLHNLIEDCPDYSYEFLRKQGFSEAQVFAMRMSYQKSRNEDLTNLSKNRKISSCYCRSKLNDLRDDMDLRRINEPLTEKDLKRLNKSESVSISDEKYSLINRFTSFLRANLVLSFLASVKSLRFSDGQI